MQPTVRILTTFEGDDVLRSLLWWIRQLSRSDRPELIRTVSFANALIEVARWGVGHCDLVVLLIALDDWNVDDAPCVSLDEGAKAILERRATVLIQTVQALDGTCSCPCLIILCPPSGVPLQAPARRWFFQHLERSIVESLEPLERTSIVTAEEIAAAYGVQVAGAGAEAHGSAPFQVAISAVIARTLVASTVEPYRALVIDCHGMQEFCKSRLQLLVARYLRGRKLLFWDSETHDESWHEIVYLSERSLILMSDMVCISACAHRRRVVSSHLPDLLCLALPEHPEHWERFLSHVWALDRPLIHSSARLVERPSRAMYARIANTYNSAARISAAVHAASHLQGVI